MTARNGKGKFLARTTCLGSREHSIVRVLAILREQWRTRTIVRLSFWGLKQLSIQEFSVRGGARERSRSAYVKACRLFTVSQTHEATKLT